METLENQVAMVTGGGSGIGRGACLALAKKGVRVMVTDINEESAKETKMLIEEAGGYSDAYQMDVVDENTIISVVSSIYDKHKRMDILFSGAGIAPRPAFCTDNTTEEWDQIIKIHLNGTFLCSRECAKLMKKNKYGRIVLTSSLAGFSGLTAQISYAAVKSGIIGFTHTLAKELGPYGITVNAIQPGFIRTGMTEMQVKAFGDKIANETPIRRVGEPEDVAAAISFFCSPEAGFITGTVLRVDGGVVLQTSVDMLLFDMCEAQSAQ